jgi:DNA-binding beta-propeller fold protein YncE
MSNNKDFKVKNGIKPTAYQEAVGTVVSNSEAYSLAGASYDSKSYVLTNDTSPSAIAFNNDGTKMYMLGIATDRIYSYNLSTAYDITTTPGAAASFTISGQSTVPEALIFNNDGTKMYVADRASLTIYQYSLSTAYQVNTASASYDSVSLDVSSQEPSGFTGISFNNDGTKLYTLGYGSDNVHQYSLSTAYDLSTASYASISFSVASQDTIPYDIHFNNAGTRMLILGSANDSIYQYSLSTAFNVSTASYDSVSFSVVGQDNQPLGITFNNDGTKMYMVGTQNDSVYQYSTVLNTASLDLSTSSVFDYTPTSDVQVILTNPAASGTSSGATLLLDQAGYGGYDIANAAYDNVSFSVASEETSLQAVEFKTDGTKMYIIGAVGDDINQYSLSTAWDISTASYEKKTANLGDTIPTGLAFKPDGTKVYIVGFGNDTVYEYSLGTAWDLATISTSASASFSVATQDGTPTALAFKSDGTAMYVLGNGNDTIFQYTLSTAWNVSTASYASKSFSAASQDNQVQGMSFKPDGSELYVVGYTNDTIYKYSLSTAWDISTASYTSTSFSVSTQEANPSAIAFNNDGTKMYIGGLTNAVYQYSTATPATITYDSALQWSGGTAPTSPAIGETDVITFNTTDGGTTYKSALAIDGAK